MKLEYSRQILEQSSNITSHGKSVQ